MVESSEESLASGDRFFSIIQIGGEDLSHLSRTHWNHCAPSSNRYNYFFSVLVFVYSATTAICGVPWLALFSDDGVKIE